MPRSPGALAIGFHFVDYVVHGWDVAGTIGAPFRSGVDVVAAALPLALAVPDGMARAALGGAFGAAPAATDAASDLGDEQVRSIATQRLLGRIGSVSTH